MPTAEYASPTKARVARRAAATTPHYVTVHVRLREQRGRAADHGCVDCGRPATGWAYDHSDPDELVSEKGQRYSPDLHRYAPRCSSCHAVFDDVAGQVSARYRARVGDAR